MLQSHLTQIEIWCKNWKGKINESKSCHITFTLKQGLCPQIIFNNIQIPTSLTTKYLGVNFDKRLTWNHHIHTFKIKLNSRLRSLNHFLNCKSKLSISTKLLLYKCLLKPIWTYGVQIWGSAKKSNIKKIQVFQNKTLRLITNGPFKF
uniref:Putative RNA-directed DNA polymerase n=1 Tax=Schizaphis graminum TaxID=13262 RepID=A0A2S2NN01_SCHGA